MGRKRTLTRRAALASIGSGAVVLSEQTFGLVTTTVDRSTDLSTTSDASALLGIEQLPPAQFNTIAVTNNLDQQMALSASPSSFRAVSPNDGPLTLAPDETRRIAFSTDGATTNDTLSLQGTITQGGETSVVVDLDRAIDVEIPDYIQNKGFAWWPCVLGSGDTVVDVLGGDHDGTVSDPGWTSGSWVDNRALTNTGTASGVVETTTLGNFGDRLDQSFAIAFTIKAPHGQGANAHVMGARGQGLNQAPYFEVYHTNDWFGVTNSVGLNVGHDYAVSAPEDELPNDQPARVVINAPSANPNQWQIYIDGSSVITTRLSKSQNGQVTTVGTLNGPFQMFDTAYDDRALDGVLDDVILFDEALTCAEVQVDYSRQPYGSGGDSANCTNGNGNGGNGNGNGNGNGSGGGSPGQYPKWDKRTLYEVGDRVRHKGTVWEADIDSRNAEPSQSSTFWSAVS